MKGLLGMFAYRGTDDESFRLQSLSIPYQNIQPFYMGLSISVFCSILFLLTFLDQRENGSECQLLRDFSGPTFFGQFWGPDYESAR